MGPVASVESGTPGFGSGLSEVGSAMVMQEARELTQKVLNLDANNGHAWHTMGQMEEASGSLEAALTCYSAGQQGTGDTH